MSEAISTGNNNGIKLEGYKGTYSLSSMREGQDGIFRAQWAKYQIGKDKIAEKNWTVKVSLGDRETAIGVLKMLLAELEGNSAPGPEEDIPF
jgi:hypothetical protein